MRQYIEQVIKHKGLVLAATGLLTIVLLAQLTSLKVIIDPDSTLPQTHPYIATGNLIEKTFGNKFTVLIGITPKEGEVYQPGVLEKVQKITTALQNSPGVIKSNISSFAARKSKDITGTEEGMIVKPLMGKNPPYG